MKPYQIKANKVLWFSDYHQNTRWVSHILELEKGNYDHIIFGGDEFDTHESTDKVSSIKETARFALDLVNGKFGPSTCLIGNHLLAYAESWFANSKYSHKHNIINSCSGFTNSKSMEINKIFKWEDYQKYQLFCEFGGYLISHAGFHPSFWNFYKTREENLASLWDESKDAFNSISVKPSHLFGCGEARGGKLKAGGPCWLDFLEEFTDNEEIGPQLIGHTSYYNTVRYKNKSYCCDGRQTTYALLDSSGKIEFKSTIAGELNIIEEKGWQYNGWVN
jgi:hypothetical protein